MKIPADELHELVHAMGRSEKRYFLRYASLMQGGKEKNPALLFRAVTRGSAYDEKKVRGELTHLGNGHFKKVKHYTIHSVLRSLEGFYSLSSDEIVVLRYLVQAEILYNKKLFGLAMKRLDRALEISGKKDLVLLALPCIEWKYRIGVAWKRSGSTLLEITERKIKELVRDTGRWMELRRLNVGFWAIIQDEVQITPALKNKLRAIVARALVLYKKGQAGYTITREAGALLGLCYRFTGDWQKCYRWRKRVVTLLEEQPEYINERCNEYLTALGNLMNACREMERREETQSLFRRANDFVQVLPARYHDKQLDERFCNLQNSYITFLLREGMDREVIQQGTALMNRLKKHPPVFLNSLVSILYRNMMYASLRLKQYRDALRYYNQWLKKGSEDELAKKLFVLVLLYESGDLDLLHYRCRSLQYHLRKAGRPKGWEMELVRVLGGDLGKIRPGKNDGPLFGKLEMKLRGKKREIDAAAVETGFNYLDWVRIRSKRLTV